MEKMVVKIGGSLLHQVDWVQRFRRWKSTLPPAHILLIVGGGDLIESMRFLSAQHHLQEDAMHWRCVHALDITWDIVRELLPESHAIDLTELPSLRDRYHADPMLALIRVASFYHETVDLRALGIEPPPHSWKTTTDTIAAILGQRTCADRVVLLKSCSIDSEMSLRAATERGIVDAALVQVLKPNQICELVQLA